MRLYQILALRNLGLGLESIAVCLDAGVDPARLVRDHLAEMEAAAAELERRRAKLRRLVEALDAGRVPDTPALLDAVRAATPSPESARVLARHLDPGQVAELQAHMEAVGPAGPLPPGGRVAGAVPTGRAAPGRRHRPRRPAGAAPGGPDRRAGGTLLRR